MVMLEAPEGTLPLVRQRPLGGWETASMILFIFFTGQWVAVLRAADTPSPVKGSSQAPSAVDAAAVSTGPESGQTEETAQLEHMGTN